MCEMMCMVARPAEVQKCACVGYGICACAVVFLLLNPWGPDSWAGPTASSLSENPRKTRPSFQAQWPSHLIYFMDKVQKAPNDPKKTRKKISRLFLLADGVIARLRLAGAAARPKCPHKNCACGAMARPTAASSDPSSEVHAHTTHTGVWTPGFNPLEFSPYL